MNLKYLFLLTICLSIFTQCQQGEPKIEMAQPNDRIDHHSYAQPDKAKTKHLDLALKVDFETKTLAGKATYTLENNKAEQVILDTRNLNIEKVTIGEAETETTFELSKAEEYLGQALKIKIEPTTKLVTVHYSTNPDAAALDWLVAQQTAGKKHPYLFTQGQAILTRTWLPCQDSPGIRFTYNATVEVPKELMAVMSAENPQQKNETGIYSFKMRQPIPPYLMALAVGDLEFSAIGERTGVYTEPSMIEKSVYEFADMEKMLISAEELYGAYSWDRYDVIVLPPSFPFGGMENPRLTFATPTIIAGDRSLTALIAHELAHSWSGNLVTNATWNDFWLNEGFTVYFERRIMEALYGEEYSNMLALLGRQDLIKAINAIQQKRKADTHLRLNLKGRDPDDGMTDIAYEKGYFLLRTLEEKVGREKFDNFLKTYFAKNAFKTITTDEFIAYVSKNLIEPNQIDIDITDWTDKPGLPNYAATINSNRFELVDAAVKSIQEGNAANTIKTKDWTTHEWLHFIRHLPQDLDQKAMKELDDTYIFTKSGNSEIAAAWYELSIYNGYSANILPNIEDFLVTVGRRKFLTPLYTAFKESDQLETAKSIYKKAKPNYHSVSTQTMDKLLLGEI